jgi:hypothetical protein
MNEVSAMFLEKVKSCGYNPVNHKCHTNYIYIDLKRYEIEKAKKAIVELERIGRKYFDFEFNIKAHANTYGIGININFVSQRDGAKELLSGIPVNKVEPITALGKIGLEEICQEYKQKRLRGE